jgi:hypothetical protein
VDFFRIGILQNTAIYRLLALRDGDDPGPVPDPSEVLRKLRPNRSGRRTRAGSYPLVRLVHR